MAMNKRADKGFKGFATGKPAAESRQPFPRKIVAAAVASCFVSGAAFANPTGMTVVSGGATAAVSGNTLTVTNTPGAILNWQAFSIGQSELTRFIQQSAASAVLNRVTGNTRSDILGTLQSNGRVFLLNPNGIVFGAGSVIDVAGLVASTLNLSNEDFAAGRMRFTDTAGAGSVINQGAIRTASGGSVYLIAPDVQNSGLITSPQGEVVLAAGKSVELVNPGTPGLRVEIAAPDTQAVNMGQIIADSGRIGIYAGLVHNSGAIRADSVVAGADGSIKLKATHNVVLENGSVVSASGAQGGSVSVEAEKMLQSGAIVADGSADNGGTIAVGVTGSLIQTASARVSANGAAAGGSVTLDAGSSGHLFTSGTISAQGDQGGQVRILGSDLSLVAATVDASGTSGGGTILVGGDFQGGGTIPHASTVFVNFATQLHADATGNGDGGKVVVWSDDKTRFFGTLSARGGSEGGNGGLLEVSSKDTLVFGGLGDAGAANGAGGTLLLDPKNIIIDSSASSNTLTQRDLVDPNPNAGGSFGDNVVILASGNTVVTDTNDDFGGAQAGAAYLYNGSTGALISALTGGNAGDRVGSGNWGWDGIRVLPSGNYLVFSPFWNSSAGALTFGSATTGTGSGVLSAANSLVGANPGDNLGSNGIFILNTGNYLVLSPNWTGGTGAITFGSQNTGVKGAVSAANSLVGSAPGDNVGADGGEGVPFMQLPNGNLLIGSSGWSNGGTMPYAGAVTWMNGNTGKLSNGASGGVISATNSLVGSGAYEYVGAGVFEGGEGSSNVLQLASGNVVIPTRDWSNGGTLYNAGAVTWMNGATGKLSDGTSGGVIGVANSLVGGNDYDDVGGYVNQLYNGAGAGNVIVMTYGWKDITGAATWMSGSTGKLSDGSAGGTIGPSNSVIGNFSFDGVGNWYNELANGNVLIFSPSWSAGAQYEQQGAVTWINTVNGRLSDGTTGGVITAANSVIGGNANDRVGGSGAAVLYNGSGAGNAFIFSSDWNGGTGAVTWINGANGKLSNGSTGGLVGVGNSLVGSATGEYTGAHGYAELPSGNLILLSPTWTDGETYANAGAATWINGTTGQLSDGSTGGVIGSANSIVGSHDFDQVGLNVQLLYASNGYGNALIQSASWNNNAGAMTWMKGATGELSNGAAGGVVGAANSVIGSNANDGTGSYGYEGYVPLAGNILIPTPRWSNGGALSNAGAVTWMDASSGLLSDGSTGGIVSAANSLVGNANGDRVGNGGIFALWNGASSGNAFINSPQWTNNGTAVNTGALTWIDGRTGQLSTGATGGIITSTNSVLGSASGDSQGSGTFMEVSSGRFIFAQGAWSKGGTAPNAGSVTSIDGATGMLTDGTTGGVIGIANSLVGSATGDQVGGNIDGLWDGYVLVRSPSWAGGKGAVTWMDGWTGKLSDGSDGGAVSASNSLVGGHVNDHVGNWGYTILQNGNLILGSPNWSKGGTAPDAGAITWMNGYTGALSDGSAGGVVSAANSLVGNAANDRVGYASAAEIYNIGSGAWNVIVVNSAWNANRGAVTWMSGGTGRLSDGTSGGAVSSLNSLVGGTAGDAAGSAAFAQLGSDNILIQSPQWTNGGANTWAGAVTWMNTANGKLSDGGNGGVIGIANSLVGSHNFDYVGNYNAYGLYWNNGNGLVANYQWNNNTGAVTWIDGASGKLSDGSTGSIVGIANSLLGSASGDKVSYYSFSQFQSGNILILSPYWSNGGATPNAGAATWMNGSNGRLSDGSTGGIVGTANSLVGSNTNDFVGGSSIHKLWNGASYGNVVIVSSAWNGNTGAATWMNGSNGQLADGMFGGAVSATNSLIGAAPGDAVGSGGVFEMWNGNFLVLSPNWNGGMGAVTFGSSANAVTGTVGTGSSLVGSLTTDRVGDGGEGNFVSLPNGNYALINPRWNNNAGAVTLISDSIPLTGPVSASNSIIGGMANSGMAFAGVDYTNDTFLVGFGNQPGGRVVVGSDVFNATSGGGDLLFSDTPAVDVTLAPGAITATLNTGTALILQANNDITLNTASDIVTVAGGAGGNLTLQAGRSIILKSNITTDNGDLTLVANDPAAMGANRDPGAGGISLAAGKTINAGSGNVAMTVSSGNIAGDITTGVGANITGGTLDIRNIGGGNISFGTGSLQATAGALGIVASNGSVSSLASLLSANSDVTVASADFAALRGDVSAPMGNVTITDTGVGVNSGVLVKNVSAGSGITINSAEIIVHDPMLGGQLSAPAINLNAVNGIGALGNPLFTDSAGAGFSASNSTSGDIIVTSTAPIFTVGGGGATFNNPGFGGYYVGAAGNLVLNGGTANDNPALFFAAGSASVSGYNNGSGGAVNIAAGTGITFSGASSNVAGALTLSTAGALNVFDTQVDAGSISAGSGALNIIATASPTHLASAGNVAIGTGPLTITGGSSAGASAELSTGTMAVGTSTVTITGGSGNNAFARLYGNPDVHLVALGNIALTPGAGANAYARIESSSPTSIYIDFPLFSSGGYLVNGVQQVYDSLTGTGFVAGGLAAILDQNLIIKYGLTDCAFCGPIIGQIDAARRRATDFFVDEESSDDGKDKDLPICR